MSKICPSNDLPVVCSVCLQSPAAHNPKIQYINFESAYDGPVVKDPQRPADEPGVYIEKIVICEICVREGARHLGLSDAEAAAEKTEAWKAYADSLEEEMVAKDRAISNLSHTVGVMLDHPVKRPLGRPHLAGPESHEEQIKKMRSDEAKKAKAKKKATPVASG